ncbi:Thiamine-phosphate synthase [Bacillus sp. THAF10]|uniref:thiamine phosphate synthase n=1 Tax=Bacillus sp. THAF10 TaxID=2587848 RepID=UPI00126964BF|nr:thiamine phosphate synthase [Bacillus sp. THAF10]QFT88224.1 Thiamine-phosphate synthase [Bacillus sp. THAF10]
MSREQLSIYFVMGSVNCQGKDPRYVLQEAIEGGITFFQFREKGEGALNGADKLALAKDLRDLCRKHHIPFIVNDDVDLALAVNADGVHIGQEDEEFSKVSEILPEDMLIGVSCHTLEEAAKAVADGADYIGVGPMFYTSTKKDIREIKGPSVIRSIRKAGYTIPIVGIGGITPSNAKEVLEHGADGIAVISAISHAVSPFEATLNLKEIYKFVKK